MSRYNIDPVLGTTANAERMNWLNFLILSFNLIAKNWYF